MNVVALDLAYAHPVGVAILSLKQDLAETTFALNAPKSTLPIWDRQLSVLKAVMQHVKKEDVVFVEDYAYAANSTSDAHLKELGGLVRHMVLKKTGVWPICVSPSTIKKYGTGKGNTKKNLILQQVALRWGKVFSDDNEADAYVLARLGRALLLSEDVPKFQKECITTVFKGISHEQLYQLTQKKFKI